MGIGAMRERVKVWEVQRQQPDGIGGYLTTKVFVGEYWAKVDPGTGGRTNEQQSVYNRIPYQITMRAGTYNITANNLLEWKGQELTVTNVDRDERRRYTIVNCAGDG